MRELHRRAVAAALAAAALLAGAGCARDTPAHRVLGYRESPLTAQRQAAQRERELRGSNTDQGRRLADDLMVASGGILGDAFVRDDRHLHVRLGSKAEADTVPDLARALILIMHQQYPGRDVAVHVRDRAGRPLIDAAFDARRGAISYSVPDQAGPGPALP